MCCYTGKCVLHALCSMFFKKAMCVVKDVAGLFGTMSFK